MQIEVIWNKRKERFEAYGTDKKSNLRSLMLVQTIDEVKANIKEFLENTLKQLEQDPVCHCGELFSKHSQSSNHIAVAMEPPKEV